MLNGRFYIKKITNEINNENSSANLAHLLNQVNSDRNKIDGEHNNDAFGWQR